MPIPGTDILTTAKLAGQMLRESRADTLHAADRARRAEVENERLRELLSIARRGLMDAVRYLEDKGYSDEPNRLRGTWRNCRPDAPAEHVPPC